MIDRFDAMGSDEGDDDDDDMRQKSSRKIRLPSGQSSPKGDGTKDDKRKHSVAAHLQAEQNKQKILKAKQERENRRNALDTQHQHLIDVIAYFTDQKPKDVEEFVIDCQEYIDLMEFFFDKQGTKSLMFYFQDHDPPSNESGRTGLPTPGAKKEKMKRVMITSGTDIPLKGLCMYFLRPNSGVKIGMKNVSDECYFGMVTLRDPDEPGIVLDTLNDILQTIYFKNLKGNTTWVTVPDADMATRIRHRFLTAITHYSEFLTDCKNDISSRLDLKEISNLDDISETAIKTTDDILEASKNPDVVQKIEHAVILWCKNIERVLAISKQMRKETDSMGPLAELAYWRNLMAKMCYIIQQTQEWQLVNYIQVLLQAKSRVLRRWKDVDSRVSDEYHESKDNVRYMYALEKFCQPLYQHDPPGMIEHINSMMYTIRTIHTTSRYYNTCEKVTALMVKISNQMVASCRRYLTNDGAETIWSQDKHSMVEKLLKCIELYETYRGSYEATKAELANNPDGKRFDFSVNNIFGRFERFCERLKKIIKIEEIFNLYNPVHESHIDGLEDISARLITLQKEIQLKSYDPLEFRQPDFDEDFVKLEGFMDSAIEGCPTAMHGLWLLERFKNLRNRCLDIDAKLWYLFQFYHNEIILIQQIYEAEKNDTPTPRGYPPFAGKISWARHLYKRLERPMKWFQEKTDVLKRDGATPTVKLFNSVAKKLIFYEILFHESWMTQCNSVYDALEAPILTLRGNMRQELVLNFDPFFRQIIEETEILRKMELEIPDIAQVVYYKKEKLYATYERIKGLLERFLGMKSKIPQDLALLMRPIMKKVEKAFMPGVTNINWTSFKTEEYFNYIEAHQNELEDVIRKLQEIITIRINQVLYDISHTMLIDIPDDRAMPQEEFLDKIHRYGGLVSQDLEYKSRICEHAVVELIHALLTSCELPMPDDPYNAWLSGAGAVPLPGEDSNAKSGGQDKPLIDPTLIPTQMTKEEMVHIYEECRHVFGFYNQKCIEALQKTARISLDILRTRTEEPQVSKRNPGKVLNRVPLFFADLTLTIPTITLKPTLNEMQQALSRGIQLICECLKRVIIWGQIRRSSFAQDAETPFYKDPTKGGQSHDEPVAQFARLQPADAYLRASMQVDNLNARLKNCFKPVMEHKDVSKLVLMMQTVVQQAKPRVQTIISQYMHYNFLWKDTREDEVEAVVATDPVITEIEAIMRTYKELDEEIDAIPQSHRAGPMDILTKEMKLGFRCEVKEWRLAYCRQLSNKYKVICQQIAKFVEECNKELQIPIKDMNDLYSVMSTLIKIRENMYKNDSMLQPIEECYAFLNSQKYRVPDDESNRADTLRYNFNKMLAKAFQTQDKIVSLQDTNRKKLIEQVAKFQQDLKQYLDRYQTKGPMKDGLSVEVATDRLFTFQDEFDELWERYTMCNSGEKLFGFPRNEYPEIYVVKKQLALLQKLYSLYNEFLRTMNSYHEFRWPEVDTTKVIADMENFQTRCIMLPKALKEWQAFKILNKKVNDLNDWCPLVELMTNKGMKDRHWDKLSKATGFKFDLDNENFTLKVVMENPLLKYKAEVEEICNSAIKEKEIEEKMRQLEMMNEFDDGEGGFMDDA
ncbi:Dynein heavy chain 5, axonemal [Orchesella cincta]|uniref:Dynein heavy chain 5, axonemal n=1 Tax=Orchesella cincta TaxID=48709 RepID=A0A1D2MTI7_ORCCI|nr:Dynein heavy chain 5, axonemal [Orchesella cincta]